MIRAPVSFTLPNHGTMQLKQIDDVTAKLFFFDRAGTAVFAPQEVTVRGELSGLFRSNYGVFHLSLLDNYTVSWNGQIVVTLVNQWVINSSLQKV